MLDPLLTLSPDSAEGFELALIDWVGVGLGGLFMLLGFMRGLWWQIMRLIGIIGSTVLARMFSGPWGATLAEATDLSHATATGIVWMGLFLAGIVVAALLGTLGKRSLEVIQLGLVDRMGGLLAGLATGIVLQVTWLVVLAHVGPQPWTADKLEGTYSRSLVQVVTTRYPVLTEGETHAAASLHQWLGVSSTPAPAND